MARTFWTEAIQEADLSVQDFLDGASALSLASPHLCPWRVVEHLEEEIGAFVHRVAGGGSGDFSQEAAGNFVLMLEAVEEYRRQAWELQETLEKLAAESLTMGRPRARRQGPCDVGVHGRALADGFSPAEAMAMANAASPSAWQSLRVPWQLRRCPQCGALCRRRVFCPGRCWERPGGCQWLGVLSCW